MAPSKVRPLLGVVRQLSVHNLQQPAAGSQWERGRAAGGIGMYFPATSGAAMTKIVTGILLSATLVCAERVRAQADSDSAAPPHHALLFGATAGAMHYTT